MTEVVELVQRTFSKVLLVALVATLLGGCGSEGGEDTPDVAGGDADAQAQVDVPTPADVPVDTAPDVAPDVMMDVQPDVEQDVDECADGGCLEDVAPDVDEDVAPDVPEDIAIDVPPDIPEDVPPPCEFECCDDEGCDDGNACTIDRCRENACTHVFDLCDDGNECTLDSCNVQTGCVHAEISNCCPMTWVWEAGFESGTVAGFGISDLAKNTDPDGGAMDAPIMWNVTSHRARSGDFSLYAGNPATFDYDNGKWVSTRATTSAVDLDPDLPSTLSFWVYMDVEDTIGIDTLNVSVFLDGQVIPVWAKNPRVPFRDWVRVSVDLSAFQGRSVRFIFHFDTVDGGYNGFEGVYVDDIAVGVKCEGETCEDAGDCDDGIDCTGQTCVEGACTYDWREACCLNAVDCGDNDHCTIDLCEAGSCRWVPDPTGTCCDVDADCDDGDECTEDLCFDHRCSHRPSAEKDCCTTDADCAVEDPCLVGTCLDDGACQLENTCCTSSEQCAADAGDAENECVVWQCSPSGSCVVSPTLQPGCCDNTLISNDFETGLLEGILVTNTSGDAGWTVHGGVGTPSQSLALYYGNPAANNYATGSSRNSGVARMASVLLPRAVDLKLAFSIFADVETGPTHDTLTVALEVRETELIIWEKTHQTELMTWHDVEVDLSGYGGETVDVVWRFDTMDGDGNDRGGVYVDDIAITSACSAVGCAVDASCDDGFGSTQEFCGDNGICQYAVADELCVADSSCRDGDLCTQDLCVLGGCEYPAIPACCRNSAECDDGNLCTNDVCTNANRCENNAITNCCIVQEDCDDGNPCTVDTCPAAGELCTHEWTEGCCLSSLDCADGDECTQDQCIDGVCAYTDRCCTTDEECDDGDDLCTVNTCEEGYCRTTPTGAEGCCEENIFAVDWTGMNLDSFVIDNTQTNFGWALVERGPDSVDAAIAPPFLYFGDPQTLTRYGNSDGGANEGSTAQSGYIDLPPGVEIHLQLSYWMNSENRFEKFSVFVEFAGRDFMLYRVSEAERGVWNEVDLNLSYAAGQPIRIKFLFETDGSVFTGASEYDYDGLFVDNVRLTTTCSAESCDTVDECGLVECVAAQCAGGACSYDVPDMCCEGASDCDDANPCTTDLCQNSVCVFEWAGLPGCCTDAGDCEDGDPCTTETCVDNRCEVELVADCARPLPYCQSFDNAEDLASAGYELRQLTGTPLDAESWRVTDAPGDLERDGLVFTGDPEVIDIQSCAVTPGLDASAATTAATLTFAHSVTFDPQLAGDAVLDVRVSDDGGSRWIPVWEYLPAQGNVDNEKATVSLPAAVVGAADVRVAFCVTASTSLSLQVWGVDDLCVHPMGAPQFDPIDDIDMDIGTILDVPVVTTDPEGEPMVLRMLEGPDFATFTDAGDGTGTLQLTPGADARGRYDIVLEATDGTFVVQSSLILNVTIPNHVNLLIEDFDDVGDLSTIGWSEWSDGAPGETNWLWVEASTQSQLRDESVVRFDDSPRMQEFDHMLVSPIFDASGTSQIMVTWEDAFSYSCCDSRELYLTLAASADGGATWSDVWVYDAPFEDDYDRTTHEIDASAVLNGAAQGRVAFRVHGDETFDLNWWEVNGIEVIGLDAGDPPVWDPIEVPTAYVGQETRFTVSATDPDEGDTDLTFLTGGDTPSFLAIENTDGRTATIVLTPQIGDAGEHDFQLRVTDGFHPVAIPVHLVVEVPGSAPVVDPVPPQSVIVGEVLRVPLSASDADGQPIAFHAPEALPGFVSLRDHGDGTATLNLAPTLDDLGQHMLTFSVDDTSQYVTFEVKIDVVYPGGLPLLGEDFEGAATLTELGWTTSSDDTSAANDWQLLHDASGYVRFADYPRVTDFVDRLISPPLDASAGTGVTIRFWSTFRDYGPFTAAPPVTLALVISTDDGGSWTPLWSHVETDGDLPYDAIQIQALDGSANVANLLVAFEITGGDSTSILRWDIDALTVASE